MSSPISVDSPTATAIAATRSGALLQIAAGRGPGRGAAVRRRLLAHRGAAQRRPRHPALRRLPLPLSGGRHARLPQHRLHGGPRRPAGRPAADLRTAARHRAADPAGRSLRGGRAAGSTDGARPRCAATITRPGRRRTASSGPRSRLLANIDHRRPASRCCWSRASPCAAGAIGWRQGLLWGLAGFAVFTLAPSLGLPPELPGHAGGRARPAPGLVAAHRAATAGGLALLAFRAEPRLGGGGGRAAGGAASPRRAAAGRCRDAGARTRWRTGSSWP